MQQYLDSIRLSLATNNYFGAIAMALILPDICASVEAENNTTNRDKYSKWFNRYLAETFTQTFSNKVIFGAKECYAARCSFSHQGTHVIEHQKGALKDMDNPAISINFMSFDSTEPKEYMRNGNILTIDVNFFCKKHDYSCRKMAY